MINVYTTIFFFSLTKKKRLSLYIAKGIGSRSLLLKSWNRLFAKKTHRWRQTIYLFFTDISLIFCWVFDLNNPSLANCEISLNRGRKWASKSVPSKLKRRFPGLTIKRQRIFELDFHYCTDDHLEMSVSTVVRMSDHTPPPRKKCTLYTSGNAASHGDQHGGGPEPFGKLCPQQAVYQTCLRSRDQVSRVKHRICLLYTSPSPRD